MFLGWGLCLVFLQAIGPGTLVDHRVGFRLPIGLVAAFFSCVCGAGSGVAFGLLPQAASIPATINSIKVLTI